MQQKHAWDKIVDLSGNVAQDYQKIQPYLQQVVSQGQRTALSGGAVEYSYVINGETVIVRGTEMANAVFKISDAWVLTQ